jgi:Domain of unknown function (DUF3854)/Family of unknown function (DUF5906)
MTANSFTAKAQEANAESAEKEYYGRLIQLGLTPDTAKDYGLSLISLADMPKEIGFAKGSGAIKIEYPNAKFCRYRFLGLFSGAKYFQKAGTNNYVYCPSIVKDTLSNVNIALQITEGEFKSIACKEVPTVALGGVSSTTTYWNDNKVLLEPLNSLPIGKTVYITFDYDPVPPYNGEPKPEVRKAELRLASMLKIRGCNVFFTRLGTNGATQKIGLDDFLEMDGSIQELFANAKRFRPTKSDGVDFLLAKYGVMQGDVVDVTNADVYSVQKFKNEEANCQNSYESEPDDKEDHPTKKFLSATDRLHISNIEFDIGCSSLITKNYALNNWRGIKTKPHYGKTDYLDDQVDIFNKVKPWTDFTDLFFSEDPAIKPYFEECMALTLQKPEIKQERICILQSKVQGIGKSFYFETIAAIMNDAPRGVPNGRFSHALVSSGGDLWDNFNSLIADRKLLVLNEIGEKGEKHTNLIKNMTTGRSLTVNEKYVKARSIKNYLQICITTNETYTHIVEPESRREVIYSISASGGLGPRLKAFWADENNQLKLLVNTPEFRSALLDYYLNYDLNGYDGSQPAPMNESKDAFIEATMHDSDFYIREELTDIPYVVPRLEYDRYMSENHNSRLTKGSFITHLRMAGYENGLWDKKNSQMNLTSMSTLKQLQRPCVLCLPGFNKVGHEQKYDVLKLLAERYFPGVKLN